VKKREANRTDQLKWLDQVPKHVIKIACEIDSGEDEAWKKFSKFSCLRKLEIHGASNIGDSLIHLPNSITNLKLLDCTGYNRIYFPAELRALNISFVENSQSNSLKSLPSVLKKLALCSCYVDDEIVKSFPKSIKHLRLIDAPLLNNQSISLLPRNLKHLRLLHCGLGNEAISYLSPSLHTLILGEESIDRNGLAKLPKGLQHLILDSDSYSDCENLESSVPSSLNISVSWI